MQGSWSIGVASGCPVSWGWAVVIEGHLNCNKPQVGGLKQLCYIQADLGVEAVNYFGRGLLCRASDLKLV